MTSMALSLIDDDYGIWKVFVFKNYWKSEIITLKMNFNFKKTGTTIIGLLFRDGIILAADTRATNGKIICDIACDKIHFISKNISCCGAGTSADNEYLTKTIFEQIELQENFTEKEPQLQSVAFSLKNILYRFQGFISAALILAGFDSVGGKLYGIYPHGLAENSYFITMGSGSLASASVLEKFYSDYMNVRIALNLAKESILAGIYNDLGSGGNVDICIIKKKSIRLIRNQVNRFSSSDVFSCCMYVSKFCKTF
nr:26S proteasome SU [Cryptomonas paramecium]